MTSVASIYNALPTVGEANKKFVGRAELFSKLAPLLAAYQFQFGVCLVHAHCKLQEGEKMIASGHVSEPETDTSCYPERWLASGEPYEFTKEPTKVPSTELFTQFRDIIGEIDVLGLYAVGDKPHSGVLQEWTEGRRNITRVLEEAVPGDIETAWLPGTGGSVTCSCVQYCTLTSDGHLPDHRDQGVKK